MFAFYLALLVGIGLAAVYLFLVFDGFQRVRREYADGVIPADDAADEYARQRKGFSWVAGGGVLVSSTLLILASVSGSTWYLLPILSLGSALAVVVAFVVDRGDLKNVEEGHR